MRTVVDVINSLKSRSEYREHQYASLPAPLYRLRTGNVRRIALAVPSMANHMSDEGWQLMLGLKTCNYLLCSGKSTEYIDVCSGMVDHLIESINPSVVVLQDKREWFGSKLATGEEKFRCVNALRGRPDIFKVTVIKDSHQRPAFHKESAEEIGCHAWICYYHPDIVCKLAPYVRRRHLIRVYHTIDVSKVPEFNEDRNGCLLSGAQQRSVYPMRHLIRSDYGSLPGVEYLHHPGYHADGTNTPEFLVKLNQFKVAICTSSIYGYALRKLIEATACGCRVVTDLPVDEKLPYIDDNLERIDLEPQDTFLSRLRELLVRMYDTYSPERQRDFAEKAKSYYNYPAAGMRLFEGIERARYNYHVDCQSPALVKELEAWSESYSRGNA